MPKRAIGIDIGSSYLRAVQLSRTNGNFHVEKVFSTQTRRSTDRLPDILSSLTTKYGFDRRALVATSLPHNSIFFRSLECDSAALDRLRSDSSAALQHSFPIPPDEIISGVCSYRRLQEGNYALLAAAADRQSLCERLDCFSQANLQPDLVDAPIFAVLSTVALNYPAVAAGRAVIVYIDLSYITLAITDTGNILFVRNIPIAPAGPDDDIYSFTQQIARLLSAELQLTWQKVFGSRFEQGTHIYLAAGVNLPKSLLTILKDILNCQITVVNPYANVIRLPDTTAAADISLAQGLALRALAPEQAPGINFLDADTANKKPPFNLKKEFTVCALLLATIAAVSLIGLFVRLSHLEAEYARTKNEITQVFQSILPQEKNIVSPLAQLEQKLQSLQKDYRLFASLDPAHLDPLDVLLILTKTLPSQGNIVIDDLFVTADSVRLNATSDSFETVYRWQRLLQDIPDFKIVDVRNVQKLSQTGKVRFTILINPGLWEKI